MGKTGFADQKVAARFGRVRALVLAEQGRFAVQGSMVAGWRVYRGPRLGPYSRLAYRDGGRRACGEGLFGRLDCQAVGQWARWP